MGKELRTIGTWQQKGRLGYQGWDYVNTVLKVCLKETLGVGEIVFLAFTVCLIYTEFIR